jgi:hypothetical protein
MHASGELDDDEASAGGGDFDQPITSPAGGGPPAEPALMGARHELRLSPQLKTPTCKCVAVALGQPDDAAFEWQTVAPKIDPTAQLVIAMSSEGIACDGEPKDSLGASYWGYEQRGDDVVVVVEAAKFGRPITAGAIIPKPFGQGHVYLRPASNAVPYGRPLEPGQAMCRVGNPGPARAAPDENIETLSGAR